LTIAWREWNSDAFAEAEATDKPVLLAIGAVWCHWCHVMDQTSYSDPDVMATIAERYVPIRVDTDQRPDVNARYNLGGWPTTAILTPQGDPLTGATYVPPGQMLAMLDEVADAYRDHKDELATALAERAARRNQADPGGSGPIEAGIVDAVREMIVATYDPEFGGFGTEPKFPMTGVLECLALLYARDRDPEIGAMLSKTLLAMARGGMYDHVEGGFFRYSTTRDWTIPHFEKMAEDHAGLLRVYARGLRLLGIDALRETLLSALGYLRTVFRNPATGFFAGSQDADEAYYALPLEDRRKREAPFVDRTVYAGWNAALASGFLAAAGALDDDALASEALVTLDALHERMSDSDGLLFHFRKPGGVPEVRGLLSDQAAYLRALLDAHEYSGEERFRVRAEALAERVVRLFGGADGALVDHAHGERLGRLGVPERPPTENSAIADALLRLSSMTGNEAYAEHARSILGAFASSYGALRIFADTYAAAVARSLWGGAGIAIVGDVAAGADFREAAARLPDPFVTCVTFAPGDPAVAARGFGTVPGACVAYVCRGTVCGPPVQDAGRLREAFDALGPV
jgi:uncharacterized protein YyaL (SSP411 family)